MNDQQREIQRRLRVIEYAEKLGNVRKRKLEIIIK